MKKRFNLFLMGLLVLTSCEKPIDSSNESESISELESQSESINLNEGNKEVAIIDEYFEDKADNSLNTYNNAFEYGSYQYDTVPNSTYADGNYSKLNDGVSTKTFNTTDWVGWYGKELNVTIDFELDMAFNISYFNVHMLQVISYGIRYPESVTLYASYDGSRYDKLSTIFTPTTLLENSEYTYNFHYENYVCARYFRFYLKCKEGLLNEWGVPASYFYFCDEIEGIEFNEKGEHIIGETTVVDNLYDYSIDTSSSFTYNKNDADYNDHINLARLSNVDIDIKHYEPLKEEQVSGNSKKEDINKLVDGNKAYSSSTSDPSWFKSSYGYGRDIVFDFKDNVAIDTINMELFNYMNGAINIPEKIAFYASDDGNNFSKVATYDTGKYQSSKVERYNLSQTFDGPFSARYLMISFITNYNLTDILRVYISEIEILGYKNKDKATNDYKQNNYKDKTVASNVCYISPNLTKEEYMPYVAFLSNTGEIKDYMFDCISLTFFQGLDKIEGNTYDDKVNTLTNYYINAMKYINENMAETNSTLKENRKMKIYVSLPMESTPDVGFETKQKKAIDTILQAYNHETLSNIEFVGFYWNNEYIPGDQIAAFIKEMKAVNDYAILKGYTSFWCPFYMADGISKNDEIDLEFTCMQPNYMFNDVSRDRLYSTAKIASILNMCVEIEIESVNNKVSVSKYYDYLIDGIKYGYMNTIKVYYQGTKAYYNAYLENYKLYEATYLYAHEKLTYDFFKEEVSSIDDYHDLKVSGKASDENITVTIDNFKSDLDIEIKQMPTYGDIIVELDGTITYYPRHNYLGNDYMILTLSNTSESKDIRIDFNINK